MKKFNEFLDLIAFYLNILLESIYNITMNTFDVLFRSNCDFVPDYCLDLNKIDYGIILPFKLKDINYDNINGIVHDAFNSGPPSYIYMRIYNNKGELIMDLKLYESLRYDENSIFILCENINGNCN